MFKWNEIPYINQQIQFLKEKHYTMLLCILYTSEPISKIHPAVKGGMRIQDISVSNPYHIAKK